MSAEDSAAPATAPADAAPKKPPTVVLLIGMAGSGKTSLSSRLNAECRMRHIPSYHINLDPAVAHLPYTPNIDIRDTVDYKNVMKEYGLGPNGAIVTSLNLFATRFDQVMKLLQERASEVDYIFVDTPGQIEVFTWSASGSIITDMLASTFPTMVLYVIDTPRTQSPVTFMSNMLYACSIMYKTRLPFTLALNKVDVVPADFAIEWMNDFESFQAALDKENEKSTAGYVNSLTRSMSLALDEFYTTLRAVSVSAATGEGTEEMFLALADAVKEYGESYVPELLAAAAERMKLDSNETEKNLAKVGADAEKE